MAYSTGAGAQVFYSATPNSTVSTVSAYAALTWTELTGVESIGEFGDQVQAVTATLLAEARVRKAAGIADAGDLTITVLQDPLSASQNAVRAMVGNNFSYPIKVLLADGADANDTDSIFYFRVKWMSARLNPGDGNSNIRRNFVGAIDSAIVEVPSVVVA
ncbi:hypothetical protein [Phenylobacterium immobile]|uniref:hypothetical protein n=1 Tax=Phenylobacterium immobile TaxID=21 RepID=UPI000AC8DFA6|nr:hypothetical protein [Phenylobacterium immobile]